MRHKKQFTTSLLGPANRRGFITTSALAIASVHTSSTFAAVKPARETIIGSGPHQYRVHHQWAKLPDKYTWQTTHNVAVDKDHNLYVIHEGRQNQPDHPSIFVFDVQGKFVRAFGNQFQGGGHGLEVRTEGKEQFLYVTGYQQVKSFAKMTLTGEVVWQQRAPMQSNKYAEGEAEHPTGEWGRNRFMPTNFAFLDDGGFLLADGYGSFFIHRYDANGKWLSCWGGEGSGKGKFNTPHGLWIDSRGTKPIVVVTDRAHDTLQRFTLEGQYLDTLPGFKLPANVDTREELLLVAELKGGISLLDKQYKPIVVLGEDSARVGSITSIRSAENEWVEGKFVHPHDACFAADGSIFVAEWVERGRITKLEKV
jgi:DNA-binding beta-propeller fold protein YncE